MNVDPMNNNDTIQIDQIPSKQRDHIYNQQDEESQEIKQRKKSSTTPTPLYVSLFYFSIIIQLFD